MAKAPTFQIEDIERLFRALLPDSRPDPFGAIDEQLLRLREIQAEEGLETDAYREEIKDSLDSIESRTFGILLLQIFRTIKFFFSLLPQGRIILLVLGGIGLVQTLLAGNRPSLEDVKGAVAASGIGAYLDSVMEDIRAVANALAEDTSELADATSQVFVSIAGKLERAEGKLEILASTVPGFLEGEVTATDLQDQARYLSTLGTQLGTILADLTPATNAASNSAEIIGPALRAIGPQIKDLPDLALKLTRL